MQPSDAMTDVLSFTEKALDPEYFKLLGIGLGASFVIAFIVILIFLYKSKIDHGFLGLIFLLTLVIYLMAFSFLIAAATQGITIKLSVVFFDGVVAFASKLISDRFLKYLESEPT
jgi:formate/nitrite transporter FocA (FNT family)